MESFTRDINEEGVFVVSEDPLPEESELHLFIEFPNAAKPFSLNGVVAHTVVIEDEDVPGMGIRFNFEPGQEDQFVQALDGLEKAFLSGKLPDQYLV